MARLFAELLIHYQALMGRWVLSRRDSTIEARREVPLES
jgi:hypothetical protein